MSNVRKVYVEPGESYVCEMPHSEVCLHMKVAGVCMKGVLNPEGTAVQLYRDDGSPFSAPILPGEAGLYEDKGGFYYYTEKDR